MINTSIVAGLALAAIFLSDVAEASHSADKYCLTQNIYFEARNQVIQGQLAVGYVVMNRVKSEKFPNTICKVIWQRKQFSWTNDGKSDRPKDHLAWSIAKLIATSIMRHPGRDNTDGAEYYHANYVKPNWSKVHTRTIVIGDHLFYKE